MPYNPFAHLLGLSPRADEGDDDKKAKKAKGRRAEEEDEQADEDDYDESAEDEEDDADAEDDDVDAEDDEDQPKGKKAKGRRADDDKDQGSARAQVAKGRRLERQRIAAIFNCKAAGVRPDMAASLALTTSLDSATAIAQLEQAAAFGVPQGGRLSLDQRMQGVQQHRLGPDAKQPDTRGPQGAAAAMTALYNQHKGINS